MAKIEEERKEAKANKKSVRGVELENPGGDRNSEVC
jgi:hypothetical protein